MNDVMNVSSTFKHPLRLAIVEAVLAAEGRLSPSELVEDVGQPLGNVSYHVRELATAGVLKEAGTRTVRGALQHFYRVDREVLRREVSDLAAFAARLAVLAQDQPEEALAS